ncbi:mediator of RNA polymerase II transcription subunit 13 isoform X2 [Cimex lectularius]|uniref:Mediator of RNA polymerase II transcription subunit 13 n=1 Tax=Cimex lectularius TaxID=79782 RepID=A0A8I6TBB4_CIMLE|nr:mediator of RNA polymerase II transcription subunit 13 isoform X2 [Cimex lectularius]
MTNPNNQTNGASLEDCHTNFFALTDLCGIKWRKVVWGEWGDCGDDVLEDPVLASYVRCLSADILCVWRRVSAPPTPPRSDVLFDQLGIAAPPPPPNHPPLALHTAKELWIFWYGEEPDLSALVSPELLSSDSEQGSWESGLSYECRSLLFKALHNLIERCLLSRDFIRLGKWYVQPYDSSEKLIEKSGHLSFSFDFFVHGESSVCASVDVRQHPAVRTLLSSHLHQAQSGLHSSPPVHVILAPFGLAGTLTGQSFRSVDRQTQRLLEGWKQFYPIDKSIAENSDLPPAVEVIVGGMKMRYPSAYVLITDLDESTSNLFNNQLTNTSWPLPPLRGVHRAGHLAERIWQESCIVPSSTNLNSTIIGNSGNKVNHNNGITVNNANNNSNISNNSSSDSNPSVINNTNSNTPNTLTSTNINTNNNGINNTNNTANANNTPGAMGVTTGTTSNTSGATSSNSTGSNTNGSNNNTIVPLATPGQWHFVDPTRKQSCTCSCKRSKVRVVGGGVAAFHRRTTTQPSTQRLGQRLNCPSSGQTDSIPIASVGSPTSAAASPSMTSVPPPDPTMPTLSPQPPASHQSPLDDKVVTTPTDFSAPKSVSSISNQVLSPYGEVAKCEQIKTPAGRTPSGPSCTAPTPPPMPPAQILKRPVLNSSEYEESLLQEHSPSHLLYDYSTLEAWLNHPVKRFKPAVPNSHTVQTLQQVFKQEPAPTPMETDAVGYGPRPGDPYEFDEEGMGVRVDTFKRAPNIKEEEKTLMNGTSQGKIGTNLFTSEGLQVSCNDLDRLFDQSDDNSGDESMQVTPPSSNKPPEDCGMTTIVRQTCPTSGILRPEELVKMFPTPPSLEHNPVASPIAGLVGDVVPDITHSQPPALLGSPNHEPIQDWSFVFKPSPVSKFVGSSKYAPLTVLPSHSLPPVTIPSNCIYKPSWSLPLQEKQANSTNVSNRSGNNNNQVSTPSNNSNTPSPGVWGGSNTGSATGTNVTQNRGNGSSVIPPAAPAPPPYSSPTPNLPYPAPPKLETPQPVPPEANSLVVIVLLTDTAFNIFRDHNFDSCTLCVCNAGPKVVGNIRGGDASMYLPMQGGSSSPPWGTPSPHLSIEEEPIRCNCGFSAVVNRRLSHRAGLFIEDEFEITGMLEEPCERENSGIGGLGKIEMELMQAQCLVINSMSNALYRAANQYRHMTPVPNVNMLALRDSNHLSAVALEQGRIAHGTNNPSMCKMEELGCARAGLGSSSVHRWGFIRAKGPACNQDIVRVMKQLQPLLQDAMQKKCSTRLWEAPTVSGPLTWRQFHRLAGRGTDDKCEPQPIPSLIVGREKDWVSLAPYAVPLWDELLLEPYSYSRDIAYVVVAPDNDFVLSRVRSFFKELSATYEVCRLGRHCPITKVLRDGILRVGKSAALKLAKEPLDDWFSLLGDNNVSNMLKLYAQVCRHHLAPHLSQVTIDRTLLDPPESSTSPRNPTIDRPAPSPRSEQPNTPKPQENQDDTSSNTGSDFGTSSGGVGGGGVSNGGHCPNFEDDGSEPPAIVVYLVEPFTLASDSPDLQRLACIALLRAFNTVLSNIPETVKSNITLQIISLESIVENGRSGDTNRRGDHMRSLALSVFSQCRKTMSHSTNNVKALTGFGTAASNEIFLKNKDEKNRAPYKVYTPAYILAKSKDKVLPNSGSTAAAGEGAVSGPDHCSILYVSYCLSEDQRWLLASATDEQGLILETVTINIHIPNRSRRRKASARKAGLQKLMDFMLSVMSQSVTPWRLVVGRVGRIGHGELKGWSWLLSKKSLMKASKHLKEICGQCKLLYPNDVPCILSACLVSLEPDSALRLMTDQFTPDERFSQASVKCQLSTPHDVTATHILVFPTSATTQSSQTAFQEQHINDPELGDDELFSVLDDDMPEGMSEFNDIFATWPDPEAGGPRSPTGSPRARQDSAPGSPAGGLTPHQHSPYQHPNRSGDGNEEVGTVLQQPLALGFLVSTAPTGRMPRWFWAACPHLETSNPAFLKNALHLHSTAIQQNSDDLLQQQTAVAGHPLDSQYTTDVLRYVLEGYNALSWLALDSNSHDRLSCLPIHMQVLMQLYHMTSALA